MTAAKSTKSASESWCEIAGYEGVYMVSDQGRVKRVLAGKGAQVKIKKLTLDKTGYLVVGLWHKNKGKRYAVHRLVAEAFVSGNKNLSVNHKNGNKQDNTATNLEWISLADNTKHQWHTGLANKSSCYKPSKIPVSDRETIRLRVAAGEKQKDIAAEYGCSQPLISWICQRELR